MLISASPSMFLFLGILLQTWVFSHGEETDIQCLRDLKTSLKDPFQYLSSSWNFNNNSKGSICSFLGVECWHADDNKVLNIRLSGLGLQGQFPQGLRNCTSMTGLDLSNNGLSGTLPTDISQEIKMVTTIDLSSNDFSGQIPVSLANCTYLNIIKLSENQFSGEIPAQLGTLSRLKTFEVSSNKLTGPIPSIFSNQRSVSFANNPGLCGRPLSVTCPSTQKKTSIGLIVGPAIGGCVLILFLALALWFGYLRRIPKKKVVDTENNRWAKRIKGKKAIKVSMFEKTASKMRFDNLMKATNNFSKDNIIGTGRTGTMYKATLPDGSFLVVKRLEESQHTEKEFKSEMNTLGSLRHDNLVPLLGFCIAKRERLLVYKHMPNGTLFQRLHEFKSESEIMDWPTRLRISIGAAKGLAWLHHTCNPRVIHRNISSKCILLDEDFEPKISEFGLARLMNPIDTHLSTFVNGEFGDLGYVAPEYARTLVATPKGDVYSFGTVLLELVSGEKPTHVVNALESFKGSLVEYVIHLSGNSCLEECIDKSLIGKGIDDELLQFLQVACSCVGQTPKERPSMFEVYHLLRAIGEKYHFTVDDEILVVTDASGPDQEELIVAR
ncbi:hypothetical protein AMTRI_Chr05g70070 [Amborella trichopoda]|uniref:Protein kinase domain-containing protein n=1 Tax=Amborella trichopoda TaxID=13333 RepID=U5DBA2_AMBTC|nr:probably inactive leucine-rich repeat receptor-like protein kinase At5g48380 [Amborella trichopoda]ERN19799.1 hypothetical protein AMTR_s00064p00147190 [Amborella trichopoda]|eukprot:XP_006858332.1 probably inactive leucine-rich repeat receptor-like protein kinase At5g48380 [Amborella trichopoda]